MSRISHGDGCALRSMMDNCQDEVVELIVLISKQHNGHMYEVGGLFTAPGA